MYQHRRLRLLSERYADKIPTWDVINEFLSRPVNHYPLDYPIHYFKLAEKLFPQCHLIANEDTERTWDVEALSRLDEREREMIYLSFFPVIATA